MTKPVPVIILDCNIRATEGIIYSFGSRGIPVVALSSEKNPPAFYSKYVTQKYISPKVQDEKALLKFLLNLPVKGVLLYSDDASILFVSKNLEALKKAGYLINAPEYSKLIEGFDKGMLFEATQKCNVPTIPTVRIHQFEDIYTAWEKLDKPIIFKPTRLAGGKFTMVKEKSELEIAYNKIYDLVNDDEYKNMESEIIAQEFLEYDYDDIYCCESYYTKDNKAVGFLSIHKIRPNINKDGTAGGRLYAGETIKNKDLEYFTKTILDYLQWNGLAHLDWFYSHKYKQYLLCEINPRLPGFSNLVTKVKFDMAYYYYADLLDLPIPVFQFKKALYFEALRMPGDITGGFYAIMKGYIKFNSFIKSYLNILKHPTYFDVLYKNDPWFNIMSWKNFLIHLLKRPFRILHK